MKILIYGAGVIGSIFATKLSLFGQDVTVLARNKRLDEIKKSGIILRNPITLKTETAWVKVIDALPEDAVFDYILVVMQRTQIGDVLNTLSKNQSKNIVFIVNTASGYAEWQQAIGNDRLMIGFPSAGGERNDGIVDYFVGKGFMRIFQTTTFGELNGKKSKRVKELIKAFRKAGIPSIYSKKMDVWQKTHVAMVTCIANALYGYGCNNYLLAASHKSIIEMVRGIKEGFAVLNALGMDPTPRKLGFFYLPAGIITLIFRIFMNTKLSEITMAKHCLAAKPEMIYLQKEFDELILESKMSTPNIDALRQKLMNKCK
ncbi:MAG: 2-dehydropantoate 2-reductase N-terminal domain-containing protein [Candidatus Izemoplasmatales bacterium]|nr:2-dehydropantoate 2-reductase N-terminal domain-containing protein [Candidatus Izemoplasmatales bacterium]